MSELTIKSTATMNDGNQIPLMGFGVFQLDDPAVCEAAIGAALEAGYRHIDTAFVYENEEQVGNAIAASGIPRDEIFLTTKSAFDHSEAEIRKVFAGSLERLKTDYVDLFLIHWPLDDATLPEGWETLIRMKEEGLCRSIGVSNISVKRFEDVIFKNNDVVPAINQMELHVYNQQQELVDYCKGKGMVMEAYSPLAQVKKLSDPGQALLGAASAHGKSVAQVMIRFLLQNGIVVLPKSQTPSRIQENADVFDFALSEDEMASLKALECGFLAREWEPDGYY